MTSPAPLLEARDVVKRYEGVTALDGAELRVAPAEIHALLGGNGAGKSTLINVLSGLIRPDSGVLTLAGEPLELRRPGDALAAEFGLTRDDLTLPVGEFGALKKRVVEIVKALTFDPRLLILDEPTSGLEEEEKSHLFGHMRRLRERGVSLVWVTHHLDELAGLADTATVFRDGRTVGTVAVPDAGVDELVAMMFGAAADELSGSAPVPAAAAGPAGEEVLRLRAVSRATVLRDISLDVRSGEVVGISGLAGAGRTELARVIMGLDRPTGGQVWVKGTPVRFRNAGQAYRRGLAMVPEDRKQLGILPDLSVAENISLSNLRTVSRFGVLVDRRAEADRGEGYRRRLAIRTPSVRERIGNLSGGNQQKAVLARCLDTAPALIIFDEPTQGIDVVAKLEVHKLIREFVASGGAAIVIASEVGELVELSSRVLVMRQGRIVGHLDDVPQALGAGRADQVKQRILALSARSDQ